MGRGGGGVGGAESDGLGRRWSSRHSRSAPRGCSRQPARPGGRALCLRAEQREPQRLEPPGSAPLPLPGSRSSPLRPLHRPRQRSARKDLTSLCRPLQFSRTLHLLRCPRCFPHHVRSTILPFIYSHPCLRFSPSFLWKTSS